MKPKELMDLASKLQQIRQELLFHPDIDGMKGKHQSQIIGALALVEAGISQLKVLSYELDEQ